MTASIASKFQPWAGWISAAVAAALNHQGMADTIYFHCGAGNPVSAVALGVVSLIIAWSGVLISWRGRHAPPETVEPRTRQFIITVGLMMAALYSVTIVFQMLAGLIIPVCFR